MLEGGWIGPEAWATTDLLKRAEFGCNEENESYSGGYPELIYIVGGMHMQALHSVICSPQEL